MYINKKGNKHTIKKKKINTMNIVYIHSVNTMCAL